MAYGLIVHVHPSRRRSSQPVMQRLRCIGAALIAIVVAGSACGSDRPGSPENPGHEPQLMAMPVKALEKCRKHKSLIPICPARVPRIKPESFHHVIAPEAKWPVFSAEWNAPSPKLSERNAPPRTTHIVVRAEHRHMFSFKWPSEPHPQGSGIKDKRKHGLLLDSPTWSGRRGTLVLAPPYPFGGIDGDHLVFKWEEEGSIYAISLHAWRPLSESIATLEAIVESIP